MIHKNLKYFFCILTFVFIIFLFTLIFGNFGITQVKAQNSCGDPELTLIKYCQIADENEGGYIFGFDQFQKCNQDCIDKKQQEGWTNFDYVECAMQCERKLSTGNSFIRRKFDANGYNRCIRQQTVERTPKPMSRSDLVCACNQNENFLHNAPSLCFDYVEKPKKGDSTVSIMENIFPKCFSISESAQNLTDCVRSVVNTGFLVGILILLVSIAFIGIQSAFSFGGSSIWASFMEKTRDIIIGLFFIGIPVAILNLISNSFNIFNFEAIVELNLGQRLRNPLGENDDEHCEGDEGEGGMVYHLVYEGDQGPCEWGKPCQYNVKFPTVAFYDCKVFFAASRGQDFSGDQHITGYFPIFDPNNMKISLNTVQRGAHGLDYAGPKVAAGLDGVAILSTDKFGNDYKVHSRFWDGENYKEGPTEVMSTNDFSLHSAPIAYQNTWLGVVSSGEHFLVADLGKDLKDKNNWKSFSSNKISYASYYALTRTPDFSRAFFVTSLEGVFVFEYSQEKNNFLPIRSISQSNLQFKGESGVCFRPSAAANSTGTVYVLCDDAGGNLLFFTIDTSSQNWTVENLSKVMGASVFFGGVVAVDEKDGIHVAFMANTNGEAHPIGYIYKENDGSWTSPIYATSNKGGFNLFSGFAHHGKIPYMGVVYEDWWTIGPSPRIGIVLFGAEV